MKLHFLASLALTSVALTGLGRNSMADEPGSLLVFPYFDNTRGEATLITVTNTDEDQVTGAIDVQFIYRRDTDCLEFNRTRVLTPGDTISVLTKFDNPNMARGYVYVFATSHTTGAAVAFDHLIGTELILTAGVPEFSSAPIVFKAGAGLVDGNNTDINHNGLRDLDGIEYTRAPDRLLYPRFIGQGGTFGWDSKLVLINLTGGAQFQALVDFIVYNDNEELFSAQYQFQCWTFVSLSDISSVFDNDFLLTTNHSSSEVFNGGHPFPETGWFWLNGDTAFSAAAQFSDPAILSLLIERNSGTTAQGDPTLEEGGPELPFTQGTQTNGSLLSTNLFGT